MLRRNAILLAAGILTAVPTLQVRAQPAAPTNAPVANVSAVDIARRPLGSGEPEQPGYEKAEPVFDNVFHVPQYLPGEPTAATIWPRVIQVLCTRTGEGLQCDGYSWSPSMGRAEYLFFTPVEAARVRPRPEGQ